MTEPGDMDELRARLARAEQDAAAARILAGGVDRDVGELGREFRQFRDQNNRVLTAMREDLTDLRPQMDEGFREMDEGFRKMAEGFRVIDDKFLEIRGALDGQAGWNQRLADMLGVLIRRQGDDSTDRS